MQELFGMAGITVSNKEADKHFTFYLEEYQRNWTLYPDVLECLRVLGDMPLGIITNGGSDQQRKKLMDTGISQYFKIQIISSEVGISKPEPGIFLTACKSAGIHPSRVFYVGDRLNTDAIAARKAGMVGVWLNRRNEVAQEMLVPVIHSLKDLVSLIHSKDKAYWGARTK